MFYDSPPPPPGVLNTQPHRSFRNQNEFGGPINGRNQRFNQNSDAPQFRAGAILIPTSYLYNSGRLK